jgi:heme/copper-type cytochrome/quinol oxidase subunit 2
MIAAFNKSIPSLPAMPLEAWCDCKITYYNGMIIGAILGIVLLATVYFVFHYWKEVKKEENEEEDEFYNGEET